MEEQQGPREAFDIQGQVFTTDDADDLRPQVKRSKEIPDDDQHEPWAREDGSAGKRLKKYLQYVKDVGEGE
jgi:hypothetical protein